MEARMRRFGLQTSPERTKVWTEPPPKLQQGRKVPVVYYLCKNRHLEHPHFIEVPLSSPEGLYLRDLINRLNVLRGKGMAAMYSWSCKRSYKNGFVWHDLAEDDLIIPAQGNEYVLKGSELLDQTPPDRHHSGLSNQKIENVNHPQQASSIPCKAEEACSSSSSSAIVIKESKHTSPPPPPPPPSLPPPAASEDDELSPSARRSSSSGNLSSEAEVRTASSSATGSRSPIKYRVCKPLGAQDASTQTDDGGASKAGRINTCTTGVSTDDGPSDVEFNDSLSEGMRCSKDVSEIVREGRSPPPTSSSASSSCGKTSTLESLIREEVSNRNSFKIVEEEVFFPNKAKLKATSTLVQLLTCGSIAVKDHHSFGLVPTYKPKFTNTKHPSAVISNSVVLGEIDCLSESQRAIGLKLKKEYLSGSTVESNNYKDKAGEVLSAMEGSSSFDVDRSCKIPDSIDQKEMSDNSCRSSSLSSLKVGSRKIIDSSSVDGSSMRFESLREEKDNMIKIEENLLLELVW